MKLATRIIAVSLAMLVVMTVAASYFTVRSAYEEFAIQRRDAAMRVAATMSELLIEAWQADGAAGLERVLRTGGPASHLGLRARWVWFEEESSPGERPKLPPRQWPSVASGEPVSIITTDEAGRRQMHTYVPVTLSPDRHGGLEFTGSLAPLERQTWRVIWTALITIGTFALVSVGIAYGTGVAWIARPLQALIAKTQRVSKGDFSGPLKLKRHDELGELADAINEMCTRLAEQQAAIQAETAQRMAALEQLRHADRLTSVGRLAAGIAHELGTPLNVVAGRASLIATGQLSTQELQSSAEAIKVEADRITAIVQQLLDFARRRPPHRAVTDLHSLVAKTADLLRQLAEKQGVCIQVMPRSGNAAALVDPSQMQQVLTNLLVNALQAMPTGGSVRMEVCSHPHTAANSSQPHFARISIADEGTGISSNDLDHIFEPFFTTKDVGQGTGLGLSIAYGIIQEHGGRIDVSSEVGRGTRFNIYLPAEELA